MLVKVITLFDGQRDEDARLHLIEELSRGVFRASSSDSAILLMGEFFALGQQFMHFAQFYRPHYIFRQI